MDLESHRQAARTRTQTLLPELTARIDWPRAQLDALRAKKLREVIAHALERSPWHRERLAGIDPGTFRLEDLPSLPAMSKTDLMADFDRIPTDPRITLSRCEEHIESGELLLDGEFVVSASGGTSGVRAVGVMKMDLFVEGVVSGLARFVARWGTRTRVLPGPAPPFIVGAAPGPHGSSMVARLFSADGAPRLSVADPLHEIVTALNAANPVHLLMYSSLIPRLLDEARAGRLRIRPKLLSPVAEPFLPEHEEAVAEVWGSAVISSWGATETGLLGAGTGFDPGMVLLDDFAIIEPVDALGRPVNPGQRADKLFVTPLRTDVLPLVRYELTDQLRVLAEPASCGSSFTRVSQVLGRLDDEFEYENGAVVHPHVFRTVLGRRKGISEYQVEQKPRGAHVRVLLAPARKNDLDVPGVIREIGEQLSRLGLREPEIRVESVAEIPRNQASGKLKRFVPLDRPIAS